MYQNLLFYRKKLFIWKRNHDILLLREALHLEPYKFKFSSSERGQIWTKISDTLNACTETKFQVTQRSCRERFKKIMDDYDKKDKMEQKASGIDAQYGEYEQLCEELKERIKECHEELEKEKTKEEEEKACAEDMRLHAMGAMKRKKSEDGSPGKQATKRRTSDTLEYLKQSMEVKKQELEIKGKELQQQQQQLATQNQMVMQILEQQRAQQQMMVSLMKEVLHKRD